MQRHFQEVKHKQLIFKEFLSKENAYNLELVNFLRSIEFFIKIFDKSLIYFIYIALFIFNNKKIHINNFII